MENKYDLIDGLNYLRKGACDTYCHVGCKCRYCEVSSVHDKLIKIIDNYYTLSQSFDDGTTLMELNDKG